jgi:hypothetical protein
MARRFEIHPSIGVARVGNSPDEYFIGPEKPWDFTPPPGGYRDAKRRLKRQGARFRVFVHDDGQPPRELTAAEAEISWSIRMANTKAAGDRFHGIRNPVQGLRNPGFSRDQLVLEAKAGPLAGPNQRAELVSDRPFMNKPLTVTLGRILTDDDGRLIVLGGYGAAASPTNTPLDAPPSDYANQDGWYDDVADGPVTATVRMRDGSPAPPVEPAWLLVAPPKFAPGLHEPVTLYDTLTQVAINRGVIPDPSKAPDFKPSFTKDIYPILWRALGIRWVFADGENEQPKQFHHFQALPNAARGVVRRLRTPSSVLGGHGIGNGIMPRNWSDDYPNGGVGTLTPLQYAIMEAWRDGKFVDDSAGGPPKPPIEVTADELDRVALDACVGAPFFPGIEVSWKFRDRLAFVEPYRLDAAKLQPGDVTAQMGVPWHSDFIDCSSDPDPDTHIEVAWWPAQRPTGVWTSADATSVSWDRGFGPGGEDMTLEEVITAWYRLGLILEKGGAYLEVDRVDQEVP